MACTSTPSPEWQGTWGPMSYEKTNRYIDLVKKHGIAVHIYYNIIDGQIKYVDENFPESVARDEDGKIIRAVRGLPPDERRPLDALRPALSRPVQQAPGDLPQHRRHLL